MSNNKALYVGSFNPITNGHIDVIRQALNVFDKVVVCIATNSNKKYDLDSHQRHMLTRNALIEKLNQEVVDNNIIISDEEVTNISEMCKAHNTYNVIRGLRATSDYDYEASLKMAYHNMDPNIQVVLFFASNEYMHLSSSIVRDIYKVRSECPNLIPNVVHEYLKGNNDGKI